jgi:hypothetical protein
MINKMMAEGVGCDVKKRIVRADGELRILRCAGVPVFESEKVSRFIGTLMDITEQEQMTQELRRREAYLAQAERKHFRRSKPRRTTSTKRTLCCAKRSRTPRC